MITITDPQDGFDLAGSVFPVLGTSTHPEITIRINGITSRVTVTGGTFSKVVDIPFSPVPIPITIDAFDGLTPGSSTDVSNTVTGQAINPLENQWVEEGYETFLQSEVSLYDSDNEKTVRLLTLDFAHGEPEPKPLLCHSQIGVGGLPNCIDWWDSEPWPLDCALHGEKKPNTRDTGPMGFPYYATGRYVGWRLFVSNQPTTESPTISFEPKGGVIDFNRVGLTISLKSSCL